MHVVSGTEVIQMAQELAEGDEVTMVEHVRSAMLSLQAKLADFVADKLSVQHLDTHNDGELVNSAFGPAEKGQRCPRPLVSHDSFSDWAKHPDRVSVPVPMVVLFRSIAGSKGEPEAFRCNAVGSLTAKYLCTERYGRQIDVLASYQTASVKEALAAWREGRPADPDAVDTVPSPPAHNEALTLPFSVEDQCASGSAVAGTLTASPLGISAKFTGYTDCASVDDMGELFTVTQENGDLMLTVFADVNQEEPTHRISLTDARNDNRHIIDKRVVGG